jgi:hypothetical protein
MVSHCRNAASTDISIDAHGMQEWRGKICGTVRIDTIASHTPRRMYIIAIMVIYGHVCHSSGLGIAKE